MKNWIDEILEEVSEREAIGDYENYEFDTHKFDDLDRFAKELFED